MFNFRYGQELLKLERVTLQCIKKTLQEIEDTKGAPFNPGEKIHLLTEQILAVLVCVIFSFESNLLRQNKNVLTVLRRPDSA